MYLNVRPQNILFVNTLVAKPNFRGGNNESMLTSINFEQIRKS